MKPVGIQPFLLPYSESISLSVKNRLISSTRVVDSLRATYLAAAKCTLTTTSIWSL